MSEELYCCACGRDLDDFQWEYTGPFCATCWPSTPVPGRRLPHGDPLPTDVPLDWLLEAA